MNNCKIETGVMYVGTSGDEEVGTVEVPGDRTQLSTGTGGLDVSFVRCLRNVVGKYLLHIHIQKGRLRSFNSLCIILCR